MVKSLLSFSILVLCFFTNGCGYSSVRVPTGAMQPTIPIDSYVIWEKTAFDHGQSVKRFDLVIHTLPFDEVRRQRGLSENDRYIFRVIGLGGEKIEIKKGVVYVNDEQLEQPFEFNLSDDDLKPIQIPSNEFFLLGDNRLESEDSRFWKPSTIGRERIIGKVVKIL
jgi:signal peptidase I